jgi:enterochelin esterase-like enzyme
MRQGKERTPSGENSVTRYTIPHTDMETPGMHTWMVWRRNLTDFAQLLFR